MFCYYPASVYKRNVSLLLFLETLVFGQTLKKKMSDPEASTSSSKPVCLFKRAKRGGNSARNSSRRRRDSSDSDKVDKSSSSEDEASVVFKREKVHRGGLRQSTSGRQSKKRWRKNDSESEDDQVGVSFKGTGTEKAGPDDQGATATVEIDTSHDRDARAIFERSQATNESRKVVTDDKKLTKAVNFEDKVYRGANNYAKFVEKKDTAFGSAHKTATGPQRAPAHLRSTVRWDYAPDICKDYKETGFCGFGDSCKFMHDRSDYKFGWQLEREMKEGTYGNDDQDDDKYAISSDEEDLPFKCYLCKESFTNPVVTRCKHYFCEKCALANYKKSQRCFACGAQTGGVFNPAKEVIAKMDKMKEESKVDNEQQADNNSDDSDTD